MFRAHTHKRFKCVSTQYIDANLLAACSNTRPNWYSTVSVWKQKVGGSVFTTSWAQLDGGSLWLNYVSASSSIFLFPVELTADQESVHAFEIQASIPRQGWWVAGRSSVYEVRNVRFLFSSGFQAEREIWKKPRKGQVFNLTHCPVNQSCFQKKDQLVKETLLHCQ